MSKSKFRVKRFSFFGYFYLATGIACIIIGAQKIIAKDHVWKIAVVLALGIFILLITWKKYSKH